MELGVSIHGQLSVGKIYIGHFNHIAGLATLNIDNLLKLKKLKKLACPCLRKAEKLYNYMPEISGYLESIDHVHWADISRDFLHITH